MQSNWEIKRISDICEYHNNKRVPLKSIDRAKRQGSYPYYGASGIVDSIDDYVFDGTYLLISEDGENLRSRKTPIAFKATGQFWVNNHAHILSEKEEGILDYLEYYFSCLSLTPYLTGAVQPKLSKQSLEAIEIPVPPLEDRLKINEILNSFTHKIANNKAMNQTLEKIAQRIFKSWFIDFDPVKANKEGLPFDGLSPEIQALFPSEFEDSELGMIPKGWEAGCLGDFTSVQGGYAFKSKSFIEQGNPVVKIKNIVGDGTIRLNDCQCVDDDLASSSLRFKLNNGDILMAMTGATVGKSGLYVGDGRNAYLNQRVARFKSSLEVDDNYFTYLNLQHPVVFNTIVKTAHGSAQPNISAKGIEQTPVIVPSLNAISKFEDIALKLFERVISNNSQNITLSKLRDRLLPKLILGQISVSEAKQELAEAV